ncbi:MAG: hypothetical protein R3F20_03035 [Planctomycetota bacterium]
MRNSVSRGRARQALARCRSLVLFVLILLGASCRPERADHAAAPAEGPTRVEIAAVPASRADLARWRDELDPRGLPSGPVVFRTREGREQRGTLRPADGDFLHLWTEGRQDEFLSVGGPSRDGRYLAFGVRDADGGGHRIVLAERGEGAENATWTEVARAEAPVDFADWPAVSDDGRSIFVWCVDELRRYRRRGAVLEPEALSRGMVKYWPAVSADGEHWAARAVSLEERKGTATTLVVDGETVHTGFKVKVPRFAPRGSLWAAPARRDGKAWLLAAGIEPLGPYEEIEALSPDAASGGLRARIRVDGEIREVHLVR